MTSPLSKGPKGRRRRRVVTEVKCADDLHAALAELVTRRSNDAMPKKSTDNGIDATRQPPMITAIRYTSTST